MLAFRYTHSQTGADVEIRQAVRVPRDLPFDVRIGARAALICWGVMPSGMLRHPVLVEPKSRLGVRPPVRAGGRSLDGGLELGGGHVGDSERRLSLVV
jgi:hypothetical protein